MSRDDLTVTVTEGGFDLHEEDEWIVGTVHDIEPMPASESKYGNAQFKWLFDLGDENSDGDPRYVWHFTPAKVTTHPRNQLRKLIKGLTGDFPQPEDTIDLAEFIGQKVKVMFEHYEAEDNDGSKVKREKIVTIKAKS